MIGKFKVLISRVNKSKDGKVLASNFGYLMLLQIAGYMFPLITIPYLARTIGVEGFGKIAFAAAVVIWFQTISDWGFSYTATRDIARNRENPKKVSEIFSNVFWARIALMSLSFVILLIAINTIAYFKENQTILLISFLLVPGHILFPEWFFQAMEKMRYITILNLMSKAFFTALIFIFINTKEDYILQPLFMSLGFLVSGGVAMYLIIVKWKVKISPPNLSSISKTIQGSTDVFINNISRNLYNSFSVVLLGFYSGTLANGILDAGRKFIEIAQSFMIVIDRIFFPFLSRKLGYHNHYAKGTLFIAVVGSTLLCLLAPFVIKIFYTEEFYQSIPILQILSVSIVSRALNSIYGTSYLVVIGKEKLMRNITLIVSLIGFMAAFPLVYYFSYWGAAVNIVVAQTLLGVSMMIAAKKNSKEFQEHTRLNIIK